MSKECITKTPGLEKEALTHCAYILQHSSAGADWNNIKLKLEFKIEVLLHLFVLSQVKNVY